jgi:peptidoglycan/LPS O-acetylase OafA/YrhL
MRAIAVLAVALGHAGVPGLRGGFVGVDVFFVISGYLITGLLLHEAEKRGKVSIPGFYLRRARRILPAAALTLVATDVAAYYLLNFVRAKQAITDSVWASFFAANVRFARTGTDYFAQSQPPSPIQHYWSLAVEEQFYLVWPALLVLTLLAPRVWRRLRGDVALLAVITCVSGASLWWSIHETSASPQAAYFSTLTRAWELGLGAALAVATPALARIAPLMRTALGWAGLAAVIGACTAYSSSTAYPGSAAVLPTLGAACLLVAGAGVLSRFSPGRLLAAPPLQYIGDRSYAFYLWHWPLLIIWEQHEGGSVSLITKLLLIAAAFGLSVVSYATVEDPIRRTRWAPRFTMLLWPASIGMVAVTAVVATAAISGKDHFVAAANAAVVKAKPHGPIVTAATLPAVAAAVRAARAGQAIPSALDPTPDKLLQAHYGYPAGCGASDGQTTSRICKLGDSGGSKTIVMFGDSHIEEWMPPVLQIAAANHWTVIPLIKQGCTPPRWIAAWGKAECLPWFKWASGQLTKLHPALTLVGASIDGGLGKPAADTVKGEVKVAAIARKASKKVIVLNDPAQLARQPLDCITAAGATMRKCSTAPTDAQLTLRDQITSAVTATGATWLDDTGWFCSENVCPYIVGSTIVYLDTGHITQTYAVQLVPQLRAQLVKALK